jgi:glycosyltransferase involved in cell wall biosynthesis
MLENGLDNFKFVLTMDEQNHYAKEVLDSIVDMKLKDYIVNLGPVDNHKVANLIEQCDAMINIARLESFSNNFVEAWQMEKVLFVTDDEWAKDSCGSAAVYLDVNDHESMINSVRKVMNDEKYYSNIIDNGKKQLNTYPTPKEKISQFVEIINKYSQKGSE